MVSVDSIKLRINVPSGMIVYSHTCNVIASNLSASIWQNSDEVSCEIALYLGETIDGLEQMMHSEGNWKS